MKNIKVIDDKTIEVDGKRYAEVPEPQSEFKVGDWVFEKERVFTMRPRVTRITKIEKTNEEPRIWAEDYSGTSWMVEGEFKREYRLATPAEIEEHLKKEAERRGYKPGVRIKYMLQGGLSDIHERIITIRDIDFRYDSLEDELCLYSCGNFSARLYSQGKWAEILPDKKKLPKTKEGYKDFSKDCINFYFNHNADKGNPDWIEKFISQYED